MSKRKFGLLAGALAFAAGLRQRRRTGKGLQIELSTAENFSTYLGEYVMDYTMNGRLHEYVGDRDPAAAPQGVYRCTGDDRWIAITVGTEQEWSSFCEVMGRTDLYGDQRFATVEDRHANHDALDEAITAWTTNSRSNSTLIAACLPPRRRSCAFAPSREPPRPGRSAETVGLSLVRTSPAERS